MLKPQQGPLRASNPYPTVRSRVHIHVSRCYVCVAFICVLLLFTGEIVRPVGRIREWIAWHNLRSSSSFPAAMYIAETRVGIIRLDTFAGDTHESPQARATALVALANCLQIRRMSFWVDGLDGEHEEVRAATASLIEHLANEYWFLVRTTCASILSREREGDAEWAKIYYRLLEKCVLGSSPFENNSERSSQLRQVKAWMQKIGKWDERDEYVFSNPLDYTTLPETRKP